MSPTDSYVNGVSTRKIERLAKEMGIFGIYAQAMIYRIRARPSWDRSSTNKKFFGSSYIGFLLIATALLISNGTQGVMVLLAITLFTGMGQVLVIAEEMLFYKNLDKEDPLYYQYNRSRILLDEHFGGVKKFRVYSLALFALIFPLLAILFTASILIDQRISRK